MSRKFKIVDSDLETSDPTPDIHQLFVDFNAMFFENKLGRVEVKWSPRMTLCAGICRYIGRNGQCSIHLSKPLLTLRSRRDLVETLLHEMIHAYLFVVDRDKEREAHGPKFIAKMKTINDLTGTRITVYHSFHDEVKHFKTHWWQCNGPCRTQAPYFGMVKRSMNRAPGPNDIWYNDHKRKCNGTFVKVREPAAKNSDRKSSRKRKGSKMENGSLKKISDVFPKAGANLQKKTVVQEIPKAIPEIVSKSTSKVEDINGSQLESKFDPPKEQVNFYGIIPFSGQGNTVGGKASGNAVRFKANNPLLLKWEQQRNSSSSAVKTCATKTNEASSTNSSSSLPGPSEANVEPKDNIVVDDSKDDVIDLTSDDEVLSLSSGGDKPSDDLCPACGIEFKEFLQTLEEHLQTCEMLNDWQ